MESAAVLRDVNRWSLGGLAQQLHGHDAPTIYGRRDVERGRRRLRELGVLPSAAFPGAPPADWLYRSELAEAIKRWRYEAAERVIAQEDTDIRGWLRHDYQIELARHDVDLTPWSPPTDG